MNLKETMRLFPDFFKKTGDSKLVKLMSIFFDQINELKSSLEKIDEWKSIDKAEGKALERIGEQYGEYRGSLDDEFYRYMIKTKIAQRRMDGSTNQLIEIISQTLGTPMNEVRVKSERTNPNSLEGIQTISIEGLPEKYLLNNQLIEIFISRIYAAVAAGISLEKITFDSMQHNQAYTALGLTVSETIVITMDFAEDVSTTVVGHQGVGGVFNQRVTITMDHNTSADVEVQASQGAGSTINQIIEI